MATKREIIYDIRELVNAYSDDSNISDEHISFMVDNTRNMLLKQSMSNLKKTVPKEALQVICLDLERDDKCLQDQIVLKSIKAIPPTLENTGRSNVYKVHAPGSRFVKNINIIDYSRLPFVSAEKYNGKQLFIAVDQHSHLVAYNSEDSHLLLERLETEGVFEDPKAAYDLSCSTDETKCDFIDAPYPMESALLNPLKQQVLQDLLLKFRFPVDDINNSEPAPVQEPQRRKRS